MSRTLNHGDTSWSNTRPIPKAHRRTAGLVAPVNTPQHPMHQHLQQRRIQALDCLMRHSMRLQLLDLAHHCQRSQDRHLSHL